MKMIPAGCRNGISCSKYDALPMLIIVLVVSPSLIIRSEGATKPVNSIVTQEVRLGFPALIDCQIKSPISRRMLMSYSWTKDSIDVTVDSRFTVLVSGSLFVRVTRKEDSGIYKCVAKTVGDKQIPMVFQAANVHLDILFAPTIFSIFGKLKVSSGMNVYLPCSSNGNPSTITTTWLWNKRPIPKTLQTKTFANGTLYIKNIQKRNEGNYTCIPANKVGSGKAAKTLLKVETLPMFTVIPPKIITASLGDRLVLLCKTTNTRIDWVRAGKDLPEYRSTSRGGSLTISDLKMEDSGTYECRATSNIGTSSHYVLLKIIGTPTPPRITSIVVLPNAAVISWSYGQHIGSEQNVEIWYRLGSSDDYHWQTINNIPSQLTSYTIKGIKPRETYLFSVRGVNDAGLGAFSPVYYSDISKQSYHLKNKQDKRPLSPYNIQKNLTDDIWVLSWSYIHTPGRPLAQLFIIEYREINSSSAWSLLGKAIGWMNRSFTIDEYKLPVHPSSYEFRLFSSSGILSEPSDVIAIHFEPRVAVKSTIPANHGNIVVIVILSFSGFVIIASLIYCFCYKNKRKKNVTVRKNERGYKCSFPYSSTESRLSDSDNDTWELNDVKLIPQGSTFVQESQENVRKHGRCKENSYLVEPASESSMADKPNFLQYQQIPKELSTDRYTGTFCVKNDEPIAFKSGRLLPEFPELRDSYDQFCTTLSENSSVENLEVKRSLKYLNSMETDLLDCPPDEIPDETHSARKRRKKAVTTGEHNHEIQQRWSMPEFTKLWYEAIDPEMGSQEQRAHKMNRDKSREQGDDNDDDYCYTTTCVAEPYRPSTNREQSGVVLVKESKSCPDIMYKELSPCLCNDSTGTSGYGSYPTTPEQPETPDVCCCQCESQSECSRDSFIEENSEIESECRASDSGYYDIGNGTKGGRIVYCNHSDQHELHGNAIKVKERHYTGHQFVFEQESRKHCSFYPNIVIQKRQDSDLGKDEHCAKLVEEFRIQKKLPQLPLQNCSIYRSYDV